MIVDVIQADEKLKSAFSRIKTRIDTLQAYDAEYCNLIDIKTDLERVDLYIEDMKMESLMNKAIGIEVLKCIRCDYEFFPFPVRNGNLIISVQHPKTCPNSKCRSYLWNRPRQVKGSKDIARV